MTDLERDSKAPGNTLNASGVSFEPTELLPKKPEERMEHGPIGFRFTEDAPRDGSFVRLMFAPNVLDRIAESLGGESETPEMVGHWQDHAEMKIGGAFFDRDGFYLSPQPKYFAALIKTEAVK